MGEAMTVVARTARARVYFMVKIGVVVVGVSDKVRLVKERW